LTPLEYLAGFSRPERIINPAWDLVLSGVLTNSNLMIIIISAYTGASSRKLRKVRGNRRTTTLEGSLGSRTFLDYNWLRGCV